MRSPHRPAASPRSEESSARSGDVGRAMGVEARNQISPLTVNRLSVYLRSLRQLEFRGVRRISSQQLAGEFHLSSTQIRKDLAQFGEFGVRGVGYEVSDLVERLAALLRLDLAHRVVIVGMGNLGTALARYPPFNSESFQVVAGFDSDTAKVGRRAGRVDIHDLRELESVVASQSATMAILTVPAEAATTSLARLEACGISAILNFAPVSLPSSGGCRVKNMDLRIPLEELAFFCGR